MQVSMVPAANPERTAAFMRQSGLVRERLVPLSDALANLADWLMGVCVSAGAHGFVGDDGAEEGAQGEGPEGGGQTEQGGEADDATATDTGEPPSQTVETASILDGEGMNTLSLSDSPEKLRAPKVLDQ